MNTRRHNLAARLVAVVFLMVAMFAAISPSPAAADEFSYPLCISYKGLGGLFRAENEADAIAKGIISDRGSGLRLDVNAFIVPCPEEPGEGVDTDGDGVGDDTDACPNESGPASNGGCPLPPTDDDNDGIPNDQDSCPDVAGPGSNNGCPLPPADSDDDGVPDDSDGCPSEAGPADNGGCPVPPSDSDGDGIPDSGDVFPDDPNESSDSDGDGVGDNADACPGADDALGCESESVDSDGDGVNDDVDQCSGTSTGAEVDVNGCPAPMPEHRVRHDGSVSNCETEKVVDTYIEFTANYVLEDGTWVVGEYTSSLTHEEVRPMTGEELAACQPDTGTPTPTATATAESTPTVVPTEEPAEPTVVVPVTPQPTHPAPTQEPVTTPEPTVPPISDHGHSGGNGSGYVAAETPPLDVADPGTVKLPVAGSGHSANNADNANAFTAVAMWAVMCFIAAVYVYRRRA